VSFWAEVFLGIIALATLTMAAIQVGVIVYGVGMVRRVNRLLTQVEQELKPLADSLNVFDPGALAPGVTVGRAACQRP